MRRCGGGFRRSLITRCFLGRFGFIGVLYAIKVLPRCLLDRALASSSPSSSLSSSSSSSWSFLPSSLSPLLPSSSISPFSEESPAPLSSLPSREIIAVLPLSVPKLLSHLLRLIPSFSSSESSPPFSAISYCSSRPTSLVLRMSWLPMARPPGLGSCIDAASEGWKSFSMQ